MGVDRTVYLMWGVDVGAEAVDWDKHVAELEGQPVRRFDMVYDGMSGEYCFAGKILAASHEHSDHSVTALNLEDIGVDRDALASRISTAFERDDIGPRDLSLIFLDHYS